MKIIVKNTSKEFYQEVVNICFNMNSIKDKPKQKIKDTSLNYIGYFVICAVMVFIMNALDATDNEYSFAFGAMLFFLILCLLATFVFIFTVCSKKKMLNEFLSNNNKAILLMDKDGVELDKENTSKNRIVWGNLKYIIINKYSIVYIPKFGNIILCVPVSYKEEILKGLRTYKQDNLIIDNSNLYS